MSILQTPAAGGAGSSAADRPAATLWRFLGRDAARLARGFRLQVILFAALIFISAVPVFLLAAWVQANALEKEIDSVQEKHLLIAKNLSDALERYVVDVEKAFLVASAQVGAQNVRIDVNRYLKSFDFNYVAVLDRRNEISEFQLAPPATMAVEVLPPETRDYVRSVAENRPGDVIFSDLKRENDRGVFYVFMTLDNGQLMIGALDPAFIRTVQRSIAFGDRGHSMVVDAKGHVVAHPNNDWEAISKDASKLSVVQKMMRGETGVSTFYSPPMQADMIAGHTAVPGVGWGVMVPQPMSELEDRARDVRDAAVVVSALGIVAASIIAWLLARFLAAPIVSIARATSTVAAGSYDVRLRALPWGSPRELRILSNGFNNMVDQLRHREIGLRTAKEQAEAANRSKTEFLANVSHELRTPLNAVIGISSIMRDEIHGPVGAPEYEQYLCDIHDSGHHLLDIINDILDVSKIEAGTLEISPTDVDVASLASECMRMVDGRAKDGSVALHLVLGENLPTLVADERMVKQILLNLLSNAVKFTPDGGSVTLSVSLDALGGYVFCVKDTGIGIAADKLESIMEPFYQIDAGYDRQYPGTGLGLALVKSMTEMHGGTVAIKSVSKQGTTVSVTFPPTRTRA